MDGVSDIRTDDPETVVVKVDDNSSTPVPSLTCNTSTFNLVDDNICKLLRVSAMRSFKRSCSRAVELEALFCTHLVCFPSLSTTGAPSKAGIYETGKLGDRRM